jgi:LPXTG-motif cell wall-anchored protein
VAASGVVVEQKKKSNTSWLLLGGLALVVTLGAVNIFKNND